MTQGRKLPNLYEIQQFERGDLDELFRRAQRMEEAPERYGNRLSGKVIASLFYEPSTRTRLSFESAVLRLGGKVIGTEAGRFFSSVSKGETLADTIRVISGYADAIILRSDRTGDAELAAKYASVPVINAGDGTGQHPTQALLDIYTIFRRFGLPQGLTIALAGDLKNGRTVHSLAYLFAKHFPENHIVFVSPPAVQMTDDILAYFQRKGVSWKSAESWDGIIGSIDVLYMTRVQKERFQDNPNLYHEVNRQTEHLTITPEIVGRMKHTAVVMHPLPRVTEILPEVDRDPRAIYFEQTRNGLFVRMALLDWMFHSD